MEDSVSILFAQGEGRARLEISDSFSGAFQRIAESVFASAVPGAEVVTAKDAGARSIRIAGAENSPDGAKIPETLRWLLSTVKNDRVFGGVASAAYESAVTELLPYNRIEASPAWMSENGFHENEAAMLLNPAGRKSAECSFKANREVPSGRLRAAKHLVAKLGLREGSEILALKFDGIICGRTSVQKISDIEARYISLPAEEFKKIDSVFSKYQLVHLATGAVYVVATDKIKGSDTLPKGSVQISYYQRQLLNLFAPQMLKRERLEGIGKSKTLVPSEWTFLESRYVDEKIYSDSDHAETRRLYEILRKTGYEKIQITPVMESYNRQLLKTPLPSRISDFFIGESSVTLKCARPYIIDDGQQVVRLSPANMTLLGVEESDKVILRFKARTARARVMKIDSDKQIGATNIIGNLAMLDTIVGIPVNLRQRLSINDLNSSVEVLRDTGYLFRKHANKQLLPLITLLFTFVSVFNNCLQIGLPLYAALVPVIIYIVFSDIRNRVK